MADDSEKKLDAPMMQPPSDALARPSVIRTKEDEAIWDEMQKPHKLSKHESATHIGLSPEVIAEMQKNGQASKFEFFDSAADSALEDLNKPPNEQVVVASNITPRTPDLEQKQQYQDDHSDSEHKKIAQYSDGYITPPTLLPDPRMMQTVTESVFTAGTQAFKNGVEHPYRGREVSELAKVPEAAWFCAYAAFPELSSLGAQKSTQLMKAIIANELNHYDLRDTALEGFANQLQASGPLDRITMALTQITVKGVRNAALELENEVKEGKRHDNPLQKYLGMENRQILSALNDPREAPLLVASNLAHNARMYIRHNYPVTAETLGYGFNPDLPDPSGKLEHDLMPPVKKLEHSPHVKNIRNWLHQLGSDE